MAKNDRHDVLVTEHLKVAGDDYGPGDIINLEPDDAMSIVAAGRGRIATEADIKAAEAASKAEAAKKDEKK